MHLALTAVEHQQLIDTARGLRTPTLLLRAVTVLNTYTGRLSKVNIWICGHFIAYMGPDLPQHADEETTLASGQIVVPAYIEPHAHPFQLYNPYTHGVYLTQSGTMISVNDNGPLMRYLSVQDQTAFIHDLARTHRHEWLWWAYFEEKCPQSNASFTTWLNQPEVVQGGEFSQWLPFKMGSADLTEKLALVRRHLGRMEGHLPGSSVRTLNLFAAAGISADHESITAEDVIHRLELGFYTALRYSPIRPDLPDILRGLASYPAVDWSKLMLTSDGATLPFLEQATQAELVKLAIASGVPAASAYRMATVNPAAYYHIDHLAGVIAPGRWAHLNVLQSLAEPRPVRTLFAGKWTEASTPVDLADTLSMAFAHADPADLPNTLPAIDGIATGLALKDAVITEAYAFEKGRPLGKDEQYLFYFDPQTKRMLSTRLKGLSRGLTSLVSTYSATGAILIIGTARAQMQLLMQKIQGGFRGISSTFSDGSCAEVRLPIMGVMSDQPVAALSPECANWANAMRAHGYLFADPFFTLLFLTEKHLPFLRLTPNGLLDIRSGDLLGASIPYRS
ncbi:MAG: adenine deaminase C-terminal domain-containing protein [Sporolactobacillus sp.]